MRVLDSPELRANSIASEDANLLTIESHETSNLKPSYYEFDQDVKSHRENSDENHRLERYSM
eukprot:m.469919 g.469919  ORF g.469919 m.469919 type:complete len:62 (+) comp29226_c0_seq1:246-431(+)